MGEELDHERVAVADALDALLGLVGDLGEGVAGEVGQLDALPLEVGPTGTPPGSAGGRRPAAAPRSARRVGRPGAHRG